MLNTLPPPTATEQVGRFRPMFAGRTFHAWAAIFAPPTNGDDIRQLRSEIAAGTVDFAGLEF